MLFISVVVLSAAYVSFSVFVHCLFLMCCRKPRLRDVSLMLRIAESQVHTAHSGRNYY